MSIDVLRVLEARIRKLESVVQVSRPTIPRQGLPDAARMQAYARRILEVEVWRNVVDYLRGLSWHDLRLLGFTVPAEKSNRIDRVPFRTLDSNPSP